MTTKLTVHGPSSECLRDFNQAHLWVCDLDANRELDFSSRFLLSTSEIARADRLKNAVARRRFVARHAFVRQVLANILGVAPEVLAFRGGTHGKPRLALPAAADEGRLAALHFNFSHAENALALAVAFGRRVGIDIEVVDPGVDVLAVARAHFTAEEFEWFRVLSAREAPLAFYRLWTRKEALLKADGRGIAARPAVTARADPQWTLRSFEFKLREKEIVGALALGTEAPAGVR